MFQVIRDSFTYNTVGAIEMRVLIVGWAVGVVWLAWNRIVRKER